MVAIVMGLLPDHASFWRSLAFRPILRNITVVTLSRDEQAWLAERLGREVDVRYLPFGVDHRYWHAGPTRVDGPPYVLSVGNDPNRDSDLLAAALRELVRGAELVVVPLRPTRQPAGQSVALQAMACGKPVVLTDTQGLWDRSLMRDGHNCLLVAPGSAPALREAVAALARDPMLRARIGAAARRTVEQDFSAERMAQAVRALLEGS